MQIISTCMECLQELGHPNDEITLQPYYEDRIAYFTCSRGHKSALLVQSPKFEVLLESGANALADGYTLEAAASFSAALERFYEFCLQVFCKHRKFPQNVYEQMFKEMARQSERQIGAFMVLYAAELCVAYIPNKKITEIRNSVIHKGQIPTPEKAAEFCEMIYKEVHSLSKILLEKYSDSWNQVIGCDLMERTKQLPKDMHRATSSGTTFFRLTKETFQEAFQDYIKFRDRMRVDIRQTP
jgi:hypothetical protein